MGAVGSSNESRAPIWAFSRVTTCDRSRTCDTATSMIIGTTPTLFAITHTHTEAAGGQDQRADSDRGVLRILIADEEDESRDDLAGVLGEWGYDVVTAHNDTTAWKALTEPDSPKLAIVGYSLPDKSGAKLCEMIRYLRGSYVYVIFLAREGDNSDVSDGMAAGADACIRKPVGLMEFGSQLSAAERIVTLQDELLATQEHLRQRATHDALTGLWNRAAILEIFAGELDRAKREDISVSVIMADLDRFKNVNDTFGHHAGDVVLQEVARRMRGATRPYDMVARYGGEEFLVIVPRCDTTFASYVAERIRHTIAAEPIRIDGHDLQLTVSLGVASVRGGQDTNGDSLIRAADKALYRAKNSGRNCVAVADTCPAQA